MRLRGRQIQGGDYLLVLHQGKWHRWIISDWSNGTGEVFGRLDTPGGSYENLNTYTEFVFADAGCFLRHGTTLRKDQECQRTS